MREPTTLVAFKLATPWFEDFFPAVVSETELANAVFFYHCFCRHFKFADIDRERFGQLSEALTPMPIREGARGSTGRARSDERASEPAVYARQIGSDNEWLARRTSSMRWIAISISTQPVQGGDGDENAQREPAVGDGNASEPDDWYVCVTTELKLRDQPYWKDLDAAVDEMVVMHGAETNDHFQRAERLLVAIETIVWALKRER